jgi:predicted NBD/HSP70 family sugar kinase
VVRRLVDAGRVVERAMTPSADGPRRGRPSVGLEAVLPPGHVAGIDFGHRHVAAAIGDTSGAVLAEHPLAVDVDGAVEEAMDIGAALVLDLARELGVERFAAAAAGVPQPIDPLTGMVQSHRIRSGWEGLIPRDRLAARLGMPVHVDNDAILGALAELRSGAGQGYENFLYVKVSSGVGAGLVLRGEIYRGYHGLAGEIGHIPLANHSELCRCGSRGCLEAAVAIPTVSEHLASMGRRPIDIGEMAEMVHEPVLDRILQDNGRMLGEILADMANLIAPSLILLGGWLGTAGADSILRGARETIERNAHPAISRHLQLRPAGHGLRAELAGAVQYAAESVPVPA